MGRIFSTPVFWLGCVVAPALAMAVDISKAYWLLAFFPDKRDLILEDEEEQQRCSGSPFGHQTPARGTDTSTRNSRVTSTFTSQGSLRPDKTPSSFVFDHPEGVPRCVA